MAVVVKSGNLYMLNLLYLNHPNLASESVVNYGGYFFPPWSVEVFSFDLNPSISPIMPPGFGMGHALFSDWDISAVLPISMAVSFFLSLIFFHSCLHGLVPSSAYAILGAGHGSMWGMLTTKKLANNVVAKRDDVNWLLGWRCGGIMSPVCVVCLL